MISHTNKRKDKLPTTELFPFPVPGEDENEYTMSPSVAEEWSLKMSAEGIRQWRRKVHQVSQSSMVLCKILLGASLVITNKEDKNAKNVLSTTLGPNAYHRRLSWLTKTTSSKQNKTCLVVQWCYKAIRKGRSTHRSD